MDFTSYTDRPVQMAADLVNTYNYATDSDALTSLDDLRRFMENYGEEREIFEDDLPQVRYLRNTLREVFGASDDKQAATLLNQILQDFGATVRISWHGGPLHLHFEAVKAGFARWLGAATAMGLTVVLCDYGLERLGICASQSCQKAFVDVSKNGRKIYCSENCAHRESVAAYRARLRTAKT